MFHIVFILFCTLIVFFLLTLGVLLLHPSYLGLDSISSNFQKQKYLQAVWELFHSELKFLHHQLLVLR